MKNCIKIPLIYIFFKLTCLPDDSGFGLPDDEYEASVATLRSLADTLEADCVLLREKKSKAGTQGQFLVRRKADSQDFMEVR